MEMVMSEESEPRRCLSDERSDFRPAQVHAIPDDNAIGRLMCQQDVEWDLVDQRIDVRLRGFSEGVVAEHSS
jgi:hypothetical protein